MIFAAIFGIALFWNDRTREHLNYALEGPLSRRHILVTKIGYILATFITANLTSLVFQTIQTGWSQGEPFSTTSALRTAFFITTMEISVATTALSVGTLVGSVILITLTVGLANLFPLVLSSIIQYLAIPKGMGILSRIPNPPPEWAMNISGAILHLSPFTNSYPSGTFRLVFGGTAIVWTILITRFALFWWDRVPIEHFGKPVFFPWVYNLYYGSLALVPALWISGILMARYQWSKTTQLGVVLLLSIMGWLFWRWMAVWVGRAIRRRRPMAKS